MFILLRLLPLEPTVEYEVVLPWSHILGRFKVWDQGKEGFQLDPGKKGVVVNERIQSQKN